MVEEVANEIKKAVETHSDIVIEYFKDSTGELSLRKVSNIHYNNSFGEFGYENDHIKGYCHLKEEERTFKILRIISVRLLPNGNRVVNEELMNRVGDPDNYEKVYENGPWYETAIKYNRNIDSNLPPTITDKPKVRRTVALEQEINEDKTIRTSVNQSQSKSSSSGGCYIATMAYGNYDHPQVMVLRRYRDKVLLQSGMGRLFVRFYYWFSPKLVKLLKNSERINRWIRKRLDRMVDRVREKYDL